ncbi:MAG: hypothetical protein J1E36_01115 [Eubacterium sp.]|nr:hypothetical protein [Eubacterium sp.]
MRYKFRYFNSIYKMGAAIIGPLQNFFITIALFLLVYYLLGRLSILIGVDNYFINETVFGIVRRIMFICAFLSVAFYCVLKKGVFLNDDSLVIARYTITPINWKPRITISYDEIEQVNVNYTDLHFTKYRFLLVVLCGDEAYNVELTLKNGKKYFFSIENQEKFCQNLNFLIENTKNR